MPLSEQEQRLLDEMERHLLQNDADVVPTSGGRTLSYRNLVMGSIIAIAGLGSIIAGITVWQSVLVLGIVLGVVGFAAMLTGVIIASTPMKSGGEPPASGGAAPKTTAPSNASFMDRINDRWDRRQQGG